MATADSFSVAVLRRMLVALEDHGGGINRTNLALKTGLNYGTCVKYLRFLGLLDCISFRHDSGHVSITVTGRGLRTILQGENGPVAFPKNYQ
jgi:hypothetical protein